MSWFVIDPDEWVSDCQSGIYGVYPGTNVPFGWASMGMRRRTPEEIETLHEQRRLEELSERAKQKHAS